MYYIYIIQSINYSNKNYVGFTEDVEKRLKAHNNGQSIYTSKYKPWKMISYLSFKNKQSAKDFEKYLKTGSGKAFLKKHFL